MLELLLLMGMAAGIWVFQVDHLNDSATSRVELRELRQEYRKQECYKTDPPSLELCEQLQKDIDKVK
jgi:hypothetical protein